MKPEMTVKEVWQDLRRCGVKRSEAEIREQIVYGTFPGDWHPSRGKGKSRTFHISTAEYEAWKVKKGYHYIESPEITIQKNDKYTQAVMEFEKQMSQMR